MRLHLREFSADPKDPFKNDLLGRESQVRALSQIICKVDGHLVALVDAPWGDGKTVFVKMCAAHLRSQEIQEDVQVVEFNAWEQSHTKNPLVDLVAAISNDLKGGVGDLLEITARLVGRLTSHVAKVSTGGLLDVSVIPEKEKSAIFESWEDIDERVGSFKQKLKEVARRKNGCLVKKVAKKKNGRLVIIVDELDRCRPSYGLDFLEVVRYLFAVEGVIVVLALNRDELCHSIRSLYGIDFNAGQYLRRFADMSISLHPPDKQKLSEYLDWLLGDTDLSVVLTTMERKTKVDCANILKLITDAPGASFRDIEQAVKLCIVVFSSLPSFLENQMGLLIRSKELAVAMIVLRTLVDKPEYEQFVYSNTNKYKTVIALIKTLGKDPTNINNNDELSVAKTSFEALLFSGVIDSYVADGKKADFITGYSEAFKEEYNGMDGEDRAKKIIERYDKLYDFTNLSATSYKEIAELIDLVTYKPTS